MAELVRNAGQTLALHKTRRAGDLTVRSQALTELQEALGLAEAPLRIECVDVSNLAGTDVVASLVVFEDGLPRKSDYRRFNIRNVTDDTAGIHEVVSRRFARYLQERHEATDPGMALGAEDSGEARRFAYHPICWSSTAANRRSQRLSRHWTNSEWTTWPCAAWPSGWRKSGLPGTPTR